MGTCALDAVWSKLACFLFLNKLCGPLCPSKQYGANHLTRGPQNVNGGVGTGYPLTHFSHPVIGFTTLCANECRNSVFCI